MSYKLYDEEAVRGIADAIRAKTGGSDRYRIADMAGAIADIPAGGGDIDGLLDGSITGDLKTDVVSFRSHACYGCHMPSISAPHATAAYESAFESCFARRVDLPALVTLGSYAFRNCNQLEIADIGKATKIESQSFKWASCLTKLVIRKTGSVTTLGNTNAFDSTPFATGAGAALYVPQSMIATYRAATNWSTVLARTGVQILPIEGSEFEI